MQKNYNSIALLIFIFGLLSALYINNAANKTWLEQSYIYDIYQTESGQNAYTFKGKEVVIPALIPYKDSPLNQNNLNNIQHQPAIEQQWVTDENQQIKLLKPAFHFGAWSLLPAFITIGLCLLTREPLTALLGGIVVGTFMLGQFDITDKVLIPNLAKEGTAAILVLYLWLLGGLLGIWSKTGAAQAFANYMTEHYVKGPRSAKLVSWFLGILFFSGAAL